MRYFFVLFVVLASPALAQDSGRKISVEFTEQEIAAQLQLNDAAVKALGGQAARAFVVLDDKYKAAMQAVQKQETQK